MRIDWQVIVMSLIVFTIIFISGFTTYVAIEESNKMKERNDYCEANDWEGYQIAGENAGSCYKYVEHESGLGTYKIYSGNIRGIIKDEK